MNKIYNYIKLTRPLNCLITALVVFVGGIISSQNNSFDRILILASIVAAIVAASGNVINDYFDIEIDKISHPDRPLAKGVIKSSNALWFYFFLNLIALFISYFLYLKLFAITILASAILFLYSFHIKKIPLIGNITVASLTAIAFLFGGLAVNNIKASVVPAVFAFMINLIRELVKDSEDIDGDKSDNVITFPIKYGFEKTKYLILALTIVLIIFTFYPFLIRSYRIEYFIIVMLVVNPLLIYSMKKLFDNDLKENFHRISIILKLNMLFGLIAIFLGK
ncbi:4-Hydroxybenzoate polyprenyltransferase [Ignavibacterium album JCM 16511]|uniref:4-Hydroxybenzoate polyprenyltransferase n=2 Tax=Ignavibacterium album TaxID=591197 RepID=I0AH84_IGNAJ|nr:4-Hydroxybenzoate polyprenyltransferase [Ignavibacterium album JCM 16511]